MHQAKARYEQFLYQYQQSKIVYLEMGVGYNTPGIIKYPFWQFTKSNPQATYICINQEDISCHESIYQQDYFNESRYSSSYRKSFK